MGSLDPLTIELHRFGKPGEASNLDRAPLDLDTIAQQWLAKLENVFSGGDVSRLETLFHQDCWWRDILTFSWDLRTIHDLANLIKYITSSEQA